MPADSGVDLTALSGDMTIVARPTGIAAGEDRRVEVAVRAAKGRVTARLEPGLWALSLRAAGVWAAAQDVLLMEKQTSADVVFRLWRTGWARGRLVTDEGDLPQTVNLVFSTPREGRSQVEGDTIEASSVACPVEKGAWRCELPAARLDLQVRARGFVPHYFWGFPVQAVKDSDLGTLAIEPGASLSGWVRRGDGSPSANSLVRLVAVGERAPIVAAGPGRRPLQSRTNQRGFFQLRRTPPGNYELIAQAPDSAEVTITVHVMKDLEAALREPLVLTPPVAMALRISPPVSPAGERWRITISRTEETNAGVAVPVVRDLPVGANGEWRRAGVAAGAYKVVVSTPSGEKWTTARVRIEQGRTEPIEIEVPIRKVRGTIQLGEQPLRARLVFGGAYGAARVTLESDDEGRFSGVVPLDPVRPDSCDLLVESVDPPVRRTLEGVRIESPVSGDESELDITLPDLALRGLVLDERGEPVQRSIITLSGDGSSAWEQKRNAHEKGEFRFEGLEPGRYIVEATAAGRASARIGVRIGKDESAAPVRLVLKRADKLVVIVLSPEETPIAGAQVHCMPRQAVIGGVTPILRTDSDGRAALSLPAGVTEVLVGVGAAGFGYRMLRAPVTEERDVRVSLNRPVGTLRLKVPPKRDGKPLGVQLFHGGSYHSVAYLGSWGAHTGGEQAPERGSFVIPQMSPGRYSICLTADAAEISAFLAQTTPTGSRCATGILQPGSELTLRLKTSSSASP